MTMILIRAARRVQQAFQRSGMGRLAQSWTIVWRRRASLPDNLRESFENSSSITLVLMVCSAVGLAGLLLPTLKMPTWLLVIEGAGTLFLLVDLWLFLPMEVLAYLLMLEQLDRLADLKRSV